MGVDLRDEGDEVVASVVAIRREREVFREERRGATMVDALRSLATAVGSMAHAV